MTPVFLKGNHEDFLLSFLHDPLSAAGWLYNGGDATLLSYGVEKRVVEYALWQSRAGLREASAMLRAALPGDHLRFYEALELYYRAGGYFFVHAGVRPGVPLEGQSEEDLLWIREEFLAWPGDFGAVVVHGHTPMLTPEDLHNRIGIDTGAFQTGKLTAVGLEGSRRWFLST
jgi:serine/threonine protein phosphatase 1